MKRAEHRVQKTDGAIHCSLLTIHFNKGFTLIELIIVLFILGLTAGLAGIYVGRGSEGREMKIFTKEVSAVLRYARSQAVAAKKTYCFVVDTDEKKYSLYTDRDLDENDEVDTGAESKAEPVVVLNKAIPETLQIKLKGSKASPIYIGFYPLGNSTGGVLEIMGREDAVFSISVSRLGQVEVAKSGS
ncbi:MAG: prepilin-type N-terminal cleavage/methylation domain-containing protein [Nitrospiraceae bacterium]|nr:MAG: prepilin-type N-terminal cleavage/methylation domain-containing protein [Nitrospiraceae bacterium]